MVQVRLPKSTKTAEFLQKLLKLTGLSADDLIIWKVSLTADRFRALDSEAIARNPQATLAQTMSGYQRSVRSRGQQKSQYAKSILLITPVDRQKCRKMLFAKQPGEVTKEDPNHMRFKYGNDFEAQFEEAGVGQDNNKSGRKAKSEAVEESPVQND